jgi:uncharacterized membrane protein
MGDIPVQIVVAAFQDEKSADEALKVLKQAKRERMIGLQDAAVIRKDEKGKLHIKETEDMSTGKGAGIGALIGGVIGLIGGPGGVILGASLMGLVGGLVASKDSGIKDERLEKLGDGLQPGTSAIVAIVEHKWVDEVRKELEEQAKDIFTEELSADIATQLEEGKEVAFTAISAEGYTEVDRVAADEDVAEVSRLVVTDEGVEAVAGVITEEGVVGTKVVETDAGITAVEGVITEEGAVVRGVSVTDEGVVAGAAVVLPEEVEEEEEEKKDE